MYRRAQKLFAELGQTQRRILACGVGGVTVGVVISSMPEEGALNVRETG